MTGPQQPGVFQFAFGCDQPQLLAARWWQDGLAAGGVAAGLAGDGAVAAAGADAPGQASRRAALAVMAAAVGAAAFGGIALRSCSDGTGMSGPEPMRSIDVQRAQGWNVGAPASANVLPLDGRTDRDVDGKPQTPADWNGLVDGLRPLVPALQPWFCPTLLQLGERAATDATLRELRPITTIAMREAYGRGAAVAELLRGVGAGVEVLLVVDLPGPETVAFAAAAAATCHVVLTFDNWPHPRGVVPAQATLAAVLYHAPELRRGRGDGARPALFALDRQRLNAYANEADRFDNRYLARLPDAAALQALGVRRVLYVVPAGERRAQIDAEETLAAWRTAGVEVQMLDLADFARPNAADAAAAGVPPAPPAPSPAPPRPSWFERYWYMGSYDTHWWFWHHYPWYATPPTVVVVDPRRRPGGATWTPNPNPGVFNGLRPGTTSYGTSSLDGRSTGSQRSGGTSTGGSWPRSSGGSSSSG